MIDEPVTCQGMENQDNIGHFIPNIKRSKSCMVVSLLDDTEYTVDVEPKSKGEQIIKKVNTHLNLEEPEFFGLLFSGPDNIQYWLDPQKSINKQIQDATSTTFKFRVMYYTPDPNSLSEYTRYLFTLQIRRDLLDGKLLCSEDTGALLASYIVQGELGNYDPVKQPDGYLKGFHFVPNQTPEIEQKIVDYHKAHRGKGPAESDHQMLDIARKLDRYGITIYPALDSSGQEIGLAIYHLGIAVFKRKEVVNTYVWECLRKLSFKKKKVLLKLKSLSERSSLRVVVFALKNRNTAKNFWKVSVNHHVFFCAPTAQKVKPSNKQGSKYVYIGRTKKEIEAVERSRRLSEQNNSHEYNISASELTPSVVSGNMISNGTASFAKSEDGCSYSIKSEVIQQSVELPPPSYSSVVSNEPPAYVSKNEVDVISAVCNSDSCDTNHDSSATSTSYEKISLLEKLKMTENDVPCDAPPVPPHVEQDNNKGLLGSFKTEVASMFQKINSEYGSTPDKWQFPSSLSASNDQIEVGKDEGSETEDNIKPTSVYTEADQLYSDRTEADEESELELRQRVIELYMPQQNTSTTYDSDSDASAMTVEDEDSAFEDDVQSLPPSSSSSLSSISNTREGYLQQMRKMKSFGDVYNIAFEMLQTERTLVKDLEVLTISFRNVVENDRIISNELMKLLFDNLDPLYDYHCSLLNELEDRLNQWDTGLACEASQANAEQIGDIMHRNMRQVKHNVQYIKKHEGLLLQLEIAARRSLKFEKVYKEFEMNSLCYLSLNSFLLKPIQRLFYYRNMLERLTIDYGHQHADAIDAKVALEEVVDACNQVEKYRGSMSNLHKLVELQRDLVCVDELVHPKRRFIREGCLHKICRKGPQPRMFFLLSDILLYTSQGVTATNQFRARAALPLRALKLEDGGVELHSLYSFSITEPNGKSFTVAASSPAEKTKWMDDIQRAIDNARKECFCKICEANKTEFILNVGSDISFMCTTCKEEVTKLENMDPEERLEFWQKQYPPLVSITQLSSEADSDDEGSYSLGDQFSTLNQRHVHSRTMSTRKVCWHRNASIGMKEYMVSLENSLSGVLRRKCKNTNKWQKMWVVFTNFCLYFFKNSEEDSAFASLPLIGYVVSRPCESEVHDNLAIKLQFKTHVYIFKADKEYDFKRWMEVLTISTENCSIQARLKTRMNGRIGSSS